MHSRFTAICLLSLTAACGGTELDAEFDDGTDAAAADEGQTEDALRGAYDYKCTGSAAVRNQGTIPAVAYMRVQSAQLTLSSRTNLSTASVGAYDPGYTFQPTKARYRSFAGTGPFGTPKAVLVLKDMRTGKGEFKTGGRGGYVSLQYDTGDAFGSVSFYCKRIAALRAATP